MANAIHEAFSFDVEDNEIYTRDGTRILRPCLLTAQHVETLRERVVLAVGDRRSDTSWFGGGFKHELDPRTEPLFVEPLRDARPTQRKADHHLTAGILQGHRHVACHIGNTGASANRAVGQVTSVQD